MQARINSREWSASRAIKCINHGKMTMHPKILIVLLEIFQRNTCQKTRWRRQSTSQFMSWLYQDLFQSTPRYMVTEEIPPAPYKKRNNFKSQCLNQELFKSEKCLSPNFDDIMIEGIFQLKLITKTHFQSWCGKCQWKVWTIITIFPYFLMG